MLIKYRQEMRVLLSNSQLTLAYKSANDTHDNGDEYSSQYESYHNSCHLTSTKINVIKVLCNIALVQPQADIKL